MPVLFKVLKALQALKCLLPIVYNHFKQTKISHHLITQINLSFPQFTKVIKHQDLLNKKMNY